MAENTQLRIIWNNVREQLALRVSTSSYNTFISPLKPIDIVNNKLILKATSETAANAVEHHAQELRDAIKNCGGSLGLNDYQLVVDGSEAFSLETAYESDSFQPSPINKKFTFDSFVSGMANKFVYEAAKSVAENPGELLNPLYIYGESGLGKTHLLHAIANAIQEQYPEKRVLYTTFENFLNEFINALTHRSNEKFRAHYRNADVLMIDDIQFLSDKNAVQEEFFHTFNQLYQERKQIVLTSDCHPDKIATLADRLRTRFNGGMIVDVQPPDLETKIAILKRKAMERKCVIPDDVLDFLAQNSNHDVRTLEGRLTKVIFASKLHEEPFSLDLAKRALSESVSDSKETETLTPDTVLSAVCGYYKMKRDDLIGKGKKAELVKARQIASYLLCEMLSLPLVSVGKIMGGRDHTTVMYSRDKVEELLRLNERFAKEVDDIKNIILKQ